MVDSGVSVGVNAALLHYMVVMAADMSTPSSGSVGPVMTGMGSAVTSTLGVELAVGNTADIGTETTKMCNKPVKSVLEGP